MLYQNLFHQLQFKPNMALEFYRPTV